MLVYEKLHTENYSKLLENVYSSAKNKLFCACRSFRAYENIVRKILEAAGNTSFWSKVNQEFVSWRIILSSSALFIKLTRYCYTYGGSTPTAKKTSLFCMRISNNFGSSCLCLSLVSELSSLRKSQTYVYFAMLQSE